MRACVVNLNTNTVENVGVMGENLPPGCIQPTQPPSGYLWIMDENAGIGWTYDGTKLVPPPAPPPPPPSEREVSPLEAALIKKGVITKSDVDVETAAVEAQPAK